MLITIFSKILEISFQASFFILAILFIRICFKRLPKRYVCFLWALVALRLLFPIEISSPFSLIPDMGHLQSKMQEELILPQHTVPELNAPELGAPESDVSNLDIPEFDDSKFEMSEVDAPQSTMPEVILPQDNLSVAKPLLPDTSQANTSEIELLQVFSILWGCGTILLLSYGFISYLRTKLKLREAVHDAENIWYCADIPSPFVMGYIKPRIYIPFSVAKEQLPYIIAHEKSHITHLDHLGKLLGYILLCVYWLNPFIWVAYFYYCKDLELACDERVILQLGDSERKPYSEALLTCSVTNKALLQSPLSFSELAIKERIINILNYKKPGFWGLMAAALICMVSVVCFLTSPSQTAEGETTEETEFSGTDEIIAHYADYDELLQALADDFTSLTDDGKRFYICPGDETPSLTTLNKISEIQLFFFTLEENMNYTVGKSSLTLKRTYKGYDIFKQENTILDNITTADDCIGYPNLYFYTDLLAVAEANHPEPNAAERPLRDLIIGHYCNDGRYTELDETFALFAPDTALEALLPLSGGTLEIFPGKDDLHKLVCYTFADASQLTFVMETEGPASTIGGNAFWFPQSGGVYTTPLTALEAQKTETFTLQATADDLKHAQEGFSDATDYLYTLPDTFSPDLFCKVAETSDGSVVLYGLRNCNSLILQDGNNLYPIFMRWYLNRGILPEIYKNDYDGDGDYEYAIYSLESSGSEAEIMRLTMLEVVDGTLVMEIFDNSRLYDYINVINVTDELGNKFTCGSFIYFEERDGQWWVRTSARVLQGDSSFPDLTQSVWLEAPLTYYDHHVGANRYFDIGEVSVVGTLDTDFQSQLDAFPGECSVDADGNLITTVNVTDYECAVTTSSYTGETVYHWNNTTNYSPTAKVYPLEVKNGVVREVPARIITEKELLEYKFGKELIDTTYIAHPHGIKQYILRDNGTIHVNVGYEEEGFLNLHYIEFHISENRQTATLIDHGFGYYLLQVNDVSGLKAFREIFTGEGHLIPSDSTHLPWKWLITLNGEVYDRPQIHVTDVPEIKHPYEYESFAFYNLHDMFHGFRVSQKMIDREFYTEFLYWDESDEIILLTDKQNQVVAITINGIEKELPVQPLHIYYGVGGSHGLSYYTDVTGDGEKELIFCEGYRNDGDSYVYLPDSMEQLTFDKIIEEITSKISIEYQKADTEENELYYKIHYENQVVEDKTYCNFDREDFVDILDGRDILTAAAEFFSYTPQKEASYIHWDTSKNCFVAKITLFIDNTPEFVFGFLYADYIWDDVANQFVIDMDTVTLSLY